MEADIVGSRPCRNNIDTEFGNGILHTKKQTQNPEKNRKTLFCAGANILVRPLATGTVGGNRGQIVIYYKITEKRGESASPFLFPSAWQTS